MTLNNLTQAKQETKEELKYQHYSSSRVAMNLVTKKGKHISFTNFQFITADKDLISYIDEEIDQGLNVVTKGKLMTVEEADPMAKLKADLKKEILAEQGEAAKKAALGIEQDMGNSKSEAEIRKAVSPASTKKVTNAVNSASSNVPAS